MKTLSIEDERNKDGKGRKFRAAMLRLTSAQTCWGRGMTATNNHHLYDAGRERRALRAVLANMRKGRKVHILEEGPLSHAKMKVVSNCLRSAGYEFVWHQGKSIALVTAAYQTSLFQAVRA